MTRRRFAPALTPLEGRSLLAPVLAAIPDVHIPEGSVAAFRATATDPSDPTAVITYSLGPGAPADATIDPASGIFTWSVPAVQAVTPIIVIASDVNGTVFTGLRVWVYDPPPLINAGGNIVLNLGSNLDRTGNFTDSDPNDTYTATVDYGDSTGTQTLALGANTTFELAHSYAGLGTYTVQVKIVDAQGSTGYGAFSVTVQQPVQQSAQPPPAPTQSPSASVGLPVVTVASGGAVTSVSPAVNLVGVEKGRGHAAHRKVVHHILAGPVRHHVVDHSVDGLEFGRGR